MGWYPESDEKTVLRIYKDLEGSRNELEDWEKRYNAFYKKFPAKIWVSFLDFINKQNEIPTRPAPSFTGKGEMKSWAEWFEFCRYAKMIGKCLDESLTPPMPPEVITKKEIHAALFCELEELPLFLGEKSGRRLIAQWRLLEGR